MPRWSLHQFRDLDFDGNIIDTNLFLALMEAGADPLAEADDGSTPLSMAKRPDVDGVGKTLCPAEKE